MKQQSHMREIRHLQSQLPTVTSEAPPVANNNAPNGYGYDNIQHAQFAPQAHYMNMSNNTNLPGPGHAADLT